MAPFLSFKNTNGLHLSAGKVHQLSNQGSEALHFIVTSTSPSHGDRVEVSLR
ncbi:hypothetical protein [Pseudoalteromonas lipolytica]|uniref:Uncharacterized protein n=1 Tax=Pseudoalteromonas lipolytica TaxID=570156 RepID=A0ABY1GFB1_9GAMM|nr:hypothetical protein [Pseudoalteromonas lipolytica]MBE0351451.1 hypothetical protein [Pseudoalteromonas lipolytica LMEB 39]SFT46449.1 hypothetical protein SAMN04487854_103126 [Pseudoalteromonas lipolytica]